MSSYCIKRTQFIPISLDEAWEFFSHPANLQKITPAHMNFRVLNNSFSDTMYAGQIITYKVSPIAGVPLFWMTEITHVVDKQYFVDEQRFGPYALWHHTHRFKLVAGGVEMTDIVHYKLPLGPLGQFAHWLFVKKQVEEIFNYRKVAVEKLFGV